MKCTILLQGCFRRAGWRLLLVPLVSLGVLAWAVGAAAGGNDEDFWIPGVDFRHLALAEGAWCRYVVIDEALGQVDSTDVYVGVPTRVVTPRGPAFWVELESHLRGAEGAPDILKMLVLEGVRRFSAGDLLGEYVLELYIQNKEGPAQAEDPLAYEAFGRVIPTADSSWVTTQDATISTVAGVFTCVVKRRTVDDTREIPTGGVKLVNRARDEVAVWFADEIPLFHLARCVIERLRETETVPPISGVPVAGPKRSRTTAELVSFGFGATSILPSVPAR